MSKRQSLKGKGIDSLLFGITENNKELEKETVTVKAKSAVAVKERVPVQSEGDIERMTVPLRLDQVEALARLERSIMRNRSRSERKQRITKNSIIRACLEVFLGMQFDTTEIPDEAELVRRIKEAAKS